MSYLSIKNGVRLIKGLAPIYTGWYISDDDEKLGKKSLPFTLAQEVQCVYGFLRKIFAGR